MVILGGQISKSTRKKSREKIDFSLGKTPPLRLKPIFKTILTSLSNFTLGYLDSGFTGGKPCPLMSDIGKLV